MDIATPQKPYICIALTFLFFSHRGYAHMGLEGPPKVFMYVCVYRMPIHRIETCRGGVRTRLVIVTLMPLVLSLGQDWKMESAICQKLRVKNAPTLQHKFHKVHIPIQQAMVLIFKGYSIIIHCQSNCVRYTQLPINPCPLVEWVRAFALV
jgi:hypothetical protein